jgi:hypothetical protein
VAITTLNPSSPAPGQSDLVSLQEASELFRETGHTVATRTLKRLAVKHGLPVVRHAGFDWASWTDLLEIHAQWVDEREARRRR